MEGGGNFTLYILQRRHSREVMEHLGEIGIVGEAATIGCVDNGHFGILCQVAFREFYTEVKQIVRGCEIGRCGKFAP